MENQDRRSESYEKPEVIDYGTLLDLTQSGHHANSDVPLGSNDTAFAPGSLS
jgi:hypothetical protein